MAYWSPSALSALANSESGGNASLVHYPNNVAWGGSSTSGSSATGLYGYLTSTWQQYAPQAGVDISQYPYAYTAPASVQNQVALITPTSAWTCPGCNSTASALAENPNNIVSSPVTNYSDGNYGLGDPNLNQLNDPAYLTGMPTYGDISASDTTGLPYGDSTSQLQAEGYYGGALHVNVTPTNTASAVGSGTPSGSVTNSGVLQGVTGASGQGTPVQVNLGAGTVADIGKWVQAPITAAEQAFSGWLASLENWFGRGMLILIGIVILFIALWKVSGSPKPQFIMPVPA